MSLLYLTQEQLEEIEKNGGIEKVLEKVRQ